MANEQKIKGRDGFEVPAHYFDSLSSRIQDRCYEEKDSRWKSWQLGLIPSLLLVVFFFNWPDSSTSITTEEDYYNLLSEEVVHWDEHLLYEQLELEEQDIEIEYLLDEFELNTLIKELTL